MAYADYRLCDVCGGKAFYDANLNYDDATEDRPSFKTAGVPVPYLSNRLDYLGDWAVLCTDCAKTYKCAIVPIEGERAGDMPAPTTTASPHTGSEVNPNDPRDCYTEGDYD